MCWWRGYLGGPPLHAVVWAKVKAGCCSFRSLSFADESVCVCAPCCRQTDPRCICCFRCFFSGEWAAAELVAHPSPPGVKQQAGQGGVTGELLIYSSHGRTVRRRLLMQSPHSARPRMPLTQQARGRSQENKSRAARDRRSSARSTQHARSGGNPALPYVSCRKCR